MAKFLPGPAVSRVSGRVGGTVFSHNKGGQYMRMGTSPVTVTSDDAIAWKNRLAGISAAYGQLTDAQRLAWKDWAAENPITDRLGMKINMSGHQAFIRCNSRLDYAGDSALAVPPVGGPPDALTALSLSLDLGPGGCAVTFAATPLAADDRLLLWACVLDSQSVNYVKNQLRLVLASDKALATDYDPQTVLEARFGPLAVGQDVVIQAQVLDSATGLVSTPLQARTTVVDTTV